MKITVVFDSLEEFRQHFGTTCAPAEPVKVWEPEPREAAAHVSGMCPVTVQEQVVIEPSPLVADPDPADVEHAEKVLQEAVPEVPFKEDPKPAEKPAPKAPRVEDVRKALAALNKKAGKNIAKELIASVGYKKLTEVPEGALVTLQSLIEEEEKNYA